MYDGRKQPQKITAERAEKGEKKLSEKILVADDDYLLRDLLHDILEQEGYEVIEASDGDQAAEYFRKYADLKLVILDVMMPGKDGFALLKEIREVSGIPVILLTALGSEESELEGFHKGACDYIRKPFHKKVFLARVKAALQYSSPGEADREAAARKLLRRGEMSIDMDSCRVFVSGKETELTNKEYQLLLYLVQNQNIVLTRDQMLEKIWGYDYEGDIRTIDTHIKMLRTDLGGCGNYIRTVRGIGYSFEADGKI